MRGFIEVLMDELLVTSRVTIKGLDRTEAVKLLGGGLIASATGGRVGRTRTGSLAKDRMFWFVVGIWERAAATHCWPLLSFSS